MTVGNTIKSYKDLLEPSYFANHRISRKNIRIFRGVKFQLEFIPKKIKSGIKLFPRITLIQHDDNKNHAPQKFQLNFERPFNYHRISTRRKKITLDIGNLSDYLVQKGFENDGGRKLIDRLLFLSLTEGELAHLWITGKPRSHRIQFTLRIALEGKNYASTYIMPIEIANQLNVKGLMFVSSD